MVYLQTSPNPCTYWKAVPPASEMLTMLWCQRQSDYLLMKETKQIRRLLFFYILGLFYCQKLNLKALALLKWPLKWFHSVGWRNSFWNRKSEWHGVDLNNRVAFAVRHFPAECKQTRAYRASSKWRSNEFNKKLGRFSHQRLYPRQYPRLWRDDRMFSAHISAKSERQQWW